MKANLRLSCISSVILSTDFSDLHPTRTLLCHPLITPTPSRIKWDGLELEPDGQEAKQRPQPCVDSGQYTGHDPGCSISVLQPVHALQHLRLAGRLCLPQVPVVVCLVVLSCLPFSDNGTRVGALPIVLMGYKVLIV